MGSTRSASSLSMKVQILRIPDMERTGIGHVLIQLPGWQQFRTAITQFALLGAAETSSITACKLASLLGARSEITPATLAKYCGPIDGFSVLLQQLVTSTGKLAMKDRVHMAMHQTKDFRFNGPEVFLMVLGYPVDHDPLIIENAIGKNGETLCTKWLRILALFVPGDWSRSVTNNP